MSAEYEAAYRRIVGAKPGADLRPKAVLHWLRGGDAVEGLEYIYGVGAQGYEGRIVLKFGDMRGDGVETGDARIDGPNMAARGVGHNGREVRGLVLSIETPEGGYTAKQELELAKLGVKQWNRIVDEICKEVKRAGAAHGDTNTLHMQGDFENYDPATGKRLEISRHLCRKLQADGPHWVEFQPGKGKGLNKVRVSEKRKANLNELKRLLRSGRTVEDLQRLGMLQLRLHTKRGGLLVKPALEFDGMTSRFESLRKFGFPDLEAHFKVIADAAKPRLRVRVSGGGGSNGGGDGLDRADDMQAEALRRLREELRKKELEELIRARRLRLNLRRKSGRELRRPSAAFDGVRVRLSRMEELGFPELAARLRAYKEPEKLAPAPVAPVPVFAAAQRAAWLARHAAKRKTPRKNKKEDEREDEWEM